MAHFNNKPVLHAQATITFNEIELRALDAMTGYGADAFLEVFYEKLGKAYMRPHEAGLRSLFSTINPPVHEALHNVNEARRLLKGGRDADQRARTSSTGEAG